MPPGKREHLQTNKNPHISSYFMIRLLDLGHAGLFKILGGLVDLIPKLLFIEDMIKGCFVLFALLALLRPFPL